MSAIDQIFLAIVSVALILLTIALFVAGFAENNGTYSIAGAVIVGCAMIALAIYNRPGGGE
jgi:hypothetical protein